MSSDEKQSKIHEYELLGNLTNENSGFAKWGFAEKEGTVFFIKEFLSPIWPTDSSSLSDEQKKKKIDACKEWTDRKREIYRAVMNASNGNIVVPRDFFRYGSRFYLITDKVEVSALTADQIPSLSIYNKLVILKVIAHCLWKLGESAVVHGDLKPDNLLIKETKCGMYTVKLIDFDSSYLETDLLLPNDIQCDPTYMAPEVFLYMIHEADVINCRADVFSAGIIFHQYLCGELPKVSGEYDYIYEAVLDNAEVVIHDSIPPRMQHIIALMLKKDPCDRLSSAYLWQLMALTTQANLSKGEVNSADKSVASKNSFYPATDEEW